MKELLIRNRQRARRLNGALLKEIATYALEQVLVLNQYSCAVHIVSPKKMAEVNWNFLQHEGSTDVITFDYKEYPEHAQVEDISSGGSPSKTRNAKGDSRRAHSVEGEIFISFEDAVKQSREFATSPESELVRYVVHGFLHLLGYDDLAPEKRKVMKKEENRVVRLLERRFKFKQLTAP